MVVAQDLSVSASSPAEELVLRTPLYGWHVAQGAKMVPFAGYDMPVHYRLGILAEHLHCREAAGLFDVSHMGQVRLSGSSFEEVARALEQVVAADIVGLLLNRQRYTQILNVQGGIVDDLMVSRLDASSLFLVLNASRKQVDVAVLRDVLGAGVQIDVLEDRALIALQGPAAVEVLTPLVPICSSLSFMSCCVTAFEGQELFISRSGYTGEDGFEISVPSSLVESFANRLMMTPQVQPIGLGARDSLRLEAGLCLYGHELDETLSPVEAGLSWSIGKRRRLEGGFTGASRILSELDLGPQRVRVGLTLVGKAPAREGAEIVDASGKVIGVVTSGGFAPSLNWPIAMGYVSSAYATPELDVGLMVRGRALPARITPLPFVPHRYQRGSL